MNTQTAGESTPPAAAEDTQVWQAEYDRARHRLDQLTGGLSDAQANWKPAPDKWSVAECVDHLNQPIGTYARCIGRAIERARARGLSGALPWARGTWVGRYIIRTLRKGPAARVPAPRVFRPSASRLVLADVRYRLGTELSNLSNLLRLSRGLPLGSVVFGTPVSALIRVSLAQAFEIHALHTHRHLDQIERLRQDPGFPSA